MVEIRVASWLANTKGRAYLRVREKMTKVPTRQVPINLAVVYKKGLASISKPRNH